MHVGWSELKDEERELPQLAFITTKDSLTHCFGMEFVQKKWSLNGHNCASPHETSDLFQGSEKYHRACHYMYLN